MVGSQLMVGSDARYIGWLSWLCRNLKAHHLVGAPTSASNVMVGSVFLKLNRKRFKRISMLRRQNIGNIPLA